MLVKLKLDFLNILSLALRPQSHFCRLALVMATKTLSHSRGKTPDPAFPHSTPHPSLHTAPALPINRTKLPRTVSTTRIILLLWSKPPACVHSEAGPARTAASPPHHSTQDCSPRQILSLLDNLHVASLLHILSCSSDMVPVSTHGIQAFKIFHKLRQLYISTLSMVSKPTGSALPENIERGGNGSSA